MKEKITKTIGEILKGMDEDIRKEIVRTVNESMKIICCENMKWEEFQVYNSSAKLMELILKNFATEYLLAVANEVLLREGIEEITIAIQKGKEDLCDFIRCNKSSLFVCLVIANKKTKKFL